MKNIIFVVLLSAVGFASEAAKKSCGPEEEKWAVEAKKVQDFKLPLDGEHATIVYVHDSLSGPKRIRIGLDGQWKTATAHNTFAPFEADPGEHTLCIGGSHGMTYRLNAKPGKIYFIGVVQPVFLGLTRLEVIQEDNGYNQIARMKLAVSHPKN
jgi:hypothetical protein